MQTALKRLVKPIMICGIDDDGFVDVVRNSFYSTSSDAVLSCKKSFRLNFVLIRESSGLICRLLMMLRKEGCKYRKFLKNRIGFLKKTHWINLQYETCGMRRKVFLATSELRLAVRGGLPITDEFNDKIKAILNP